MNQGVIQNLKTINRRNLLLKFVEEEGNNFLAFWKNLIIWILFTIFICLEINETANFKKIVAENISRKWEIYWFWKECETVQTVFNTLQGIYGCENVDEETVCDWLNRNNNLDGHKIFIDDEIVQRVTGTVPLETIPTEKEEDFIPERSMS